MDISFIIVNRNTKDLLLNCIRSIKTTFKRPCEVRVVDNGSSDGSAQAVRELFPEVLVTENGYNAGFARANNTALAGSGSKYALLLNTDTVLTEGAAETLIDFMENTPAAACCGGQLLNADGSLQNSIANIPGLLTELGNKSLLRLLWPSRFPRKAELPEGPSEVDSLIGACMAVRRKAIEQAGPLDEDYFFFFEETDWCLRFKKSGWKVFYHPGARIYHLQGQTVQKNYYKARIEYWRSRYIFFRKHRGAAARLVLRAGLIVKVVLELASNLGFLIFSAFTSKRAARKVKLCLILLAWHVVGCPRSWGLSSR